MDIAKEILKKIDKISPISPVINKALRMIKEKDTTVQQLVDVIKYDESITAMVLKLCNSAAFGLRRKIGSLKEAIMYLGLNQLKNILLITAAKEHFVPSPGYEVRKGELWEHSITCAMVTVCMEKYIEQKGIDKDLAFTVALLHDIGKVIFSEYIYEKYEKIYEIVKEENKSFLEIERELFGIDHAKIGGMVMKKWEFPFEIVEAVEKHHSPSKSDPILVHIVHFADLIALQMGQETSIDGLAYEGISEVCKECCIQMNDIFYIISCVTDKVKEIKDIF